MLTLVGCGGGPADLGGGRVATVSAKGRVVLADGQPVTKGIITLEPPVDGGSPNQAMGEIQPDGTFVPTSAMPKDGAMPGRSRAKVESEIVKAKKKGAEIVAEVRPGQDLEIKLP